MRGLLLLLLLSLTVVGCGFRLAGAGAVLNHVRVVYKQPYQVVPPPLIDALNMRLSGGQESKKNARLVIHDIETVQRVAAISPVDGRATAYELTTTVHFDFLVDGEALLRDQALATRRVYSFDTSQRLAANRERQALQAAMQRDLADLILLRVDTVLDQHPGGFG